MPGHVLGPQPFLATCQVVSQYAKPKHCLGEEDDDRFAQNRKCKVFQDFWQLLWLLSVLK